MEFSVQGVVPEGKETVFSWEHFAWCPISLKHNNMAQELFLKAKRQPSHDLFHHHVARHLFEHDNVHHRVWKPFRQERPLKVRPLQELNTHVQMAVKHFQLSMKKICLLRNYEMHDCITYFTIMQLHACIRMYKDSSFSAVYYLPK